MENTKTYIALVPLRGGSKSIPKKNIKELAGYPLCYYSIKAALDSAIFQKVVISTDSFEIASVCEKYFGTRITISMRPEELAMDTSSTESVMLNVAKQFDFDVLCTIQATSPLVEAKDFQEAKQKFEFENGNSLTTGVISKRFFWNPYSSLPINYDPLNRPRRQDFEGWFMENGAFYFTDKSLLIEKECRLGGKIILYTMNLETDIEIDEPHDWISLEQIILQKRKDNKKDIKERIRKIKLIVTDVDGTLTDAGMYYNHEGDFMKKFNTRDAMGLKIIENDLKIPTIILTREDIDIVRRRAEKLSFQAFLGVKEKKTFLENYLLENNLLWENIAYFGDDLNDLECMQTVGFAACPSNAEEQIQEVCHFISSKKGGEGAVREICNLIIKEFQN